MRPGQHLALVWFWSLRTSGVQYTIVWSCLTRYFNDTIMFFLIFSGLVQGMITGIRGLCNGLGPALYGFIFFLFDVELNGIAPIQADYNIPIQTPTEVSARKYIFIGPLIQLADVVQTI